MSRPDFLTAPGTWVRASRVSQTAADYASPIECRRVERNSHRAMYVLAVIFAALALAGYLGS
jgi:hypothetical protein